MTVVTELDLPEIDYNQPGFGPDTYHELLGAARRQNWLAHSPLAYIVLDGESGDFFPRSRQTTFPGRESRARGGPDVPRPRLPGFELAGEPVLGGIEDIDNVEWLPLRWAAVG